MQPKPGQATPPRPPSLGDPLRDEPAPGENLALRLIERFQSTAYQPPMIADVAARLVELSRRPFKPAEALALLERDPFFAGRVMQVAQSPVHSGPGGVSSLAEAVTCLGQDTLGPMFLAAATKMRVFRNRAYLRPMELVHRHSTVVAHLARLASRHTRLDPELAFTAGLLHDAGIVAAMMIYGDDDSVPSPIEFEAVWPAIRPVHARATEWLCGRWKLQPAVARALANHHEVRRAGLPDPLTALVGLADGLAAELGFPALDEVDPAQVAAGFAALGLSANQRDGLRSDATALLAKLR